jgi:chemotaxis protein methyltransferase CheR
LPPKSITASEYDDFRKYLEGVSGIVLGDNKQYLVSSRVTKLMTEHRTETLGDLVALIKGGTVRGLKERIIEAMTTNETSWFRDRHPFSMLKETIYPELGKQKKNPVRIWSAACSSGQEPYSLSMITQEFQVSNPGVLPGTVQIVATDISPAMLRSAEQGKYDGLAMARGLDEERKKKFFKITPAYCEVLPMIKARVQFRELNLLQSYALLGKFDVIFCRNVLIYFATDSKCDIIKRMAGALNPGGYLFLGGSESMTGVSELFDMVRTSSGVVYKLRS